MKNAQNRGREYLRFHYVTFLTRGTLRENAKTWKSHVFHDFSTSQTISKPLLNQCPTSLAGRLSVPLLTEHQQIHDIHAELRQPRWLERDLENPDHAEFHSVSLKARDRKCFTSPSLRAPTHNCDLTQIYQCARADGGEKSERYLKNAREKSRPHLLKINFHLSEDWMGFENIFTKRDSFLIAFSKRKYETHIRILCNFF